MRWPYSSVNVRCCVNMIGEALKTKNILHVRLLCFSNHIFYKVRRDKENATFISVNDITRKANCGTDSDRPIEAGHFKITNWGRIIATIIDLVIRNFIDLFNITDSSPDYSTTGFGVVFNGCRKITTYESALIYFIVHIDYDDVTFNQTIYNPEIMRATASFRMPDVFN